MMALVLTQGRIICPDKVETWITEVNRLIVVEIEPFFIECRIVRIDRVVLKLRVKGSISLGYFHLHELVVGQLFLPQDFCAFQHLRFVFLKELVRMFLMQLIKEIDKKFFPLFPQLCVIRIGYDSPVFPALELRVLQGVGQKGVIMQDCSHIHDVRIGVPRLHHSLVEPVQELLPLFRCVDVLIVLDIVQDNKVRTPAPVFPSSKFLSGSYCIHLDAIGHP